MLPSLNSGHALTLFSHASAFSASPSPLALPLFLLKSLPPFHFPPRPFEAPGRQERTDLTPGGRKGPFGQPGRHQGGRKGPFWTACEAPGRHQGGRKGPTGQPARHQGGTREAGKDRLDTREAGKDHLDSMRGAREGKRTRKRKRPVLRVGC